MSGGAKRHRIPVRFTNGAFELEIGGAVPLKEGTICELTITEDAIDDADLLKDLRTTKYMKLFPQGTKLVVMLSGSQPEQVPPELKKITLPSHFSEHQLGNWFVDYDRKTSASNFVQIELGQPHNHQTTFPEFADGGLWLQVQGLRATGLKSSKVILPEVLERKTAQSLNHAYTLLSEAFEPWRMSHTGNIYDQILYQEGNEKWYPLHYLRDEKEMEAGQTIAKNHWDSFMSKMKLTNRGSA